MNITENLNRIQQAKSDIRAAIIQKGGTISEGAKIDQYADAVGNIPSGGDDTLDKLFGQTLEEIHSTTPVKWGQYLFNNQRKLRVADIVIGSNTSSDSYAAMFQDCIALVQAPKLPTTTLVSGCYQYMFRNCTSLTTAPDLPATTLASSCYYGMFYNCIALTKAHDLPATTLVSGCYQYMFNSCKALTTAPKLPATTLANYCYQYMFRNCASLVQAPDLPATTLKTNCYYNMFNGCKALTTAPDLPATTLADICYSQMFQDCTSLQKTGKIYATGNISSPTASMFSGCTKLKEMTWMATTPPTINANIWNKCPSNMVIYVPDESVDAYKAASVWKTRADYIKPMSEKPTE